MASEPPTFKIVALGSSGVGKSSIIQRLVGGTFCEQQNTTCGADFYSYACTAGGQQVKLQIWDTAGQERFRAISKAYFRNAVGAILVFDISDMQSFVELGEWLNELQKLAMPNAYVLLVANKLDLENRRQVGASEVKAFAETHQLAVIETSACSGVNVESAFTRLTNEVLVRVKNGLIQLGPGPTVQHDLQVKATTKEENKRNCCYLAVMRSPS
jgi:small GTP-binding protein